MRSKGETLCKIALLRKERDLSNDCYIVEYLNVLIAELQKTLKERVL